MYRKSLALFAIMLVALLATACGVTSAPTPVPPTAAPPIVNVNVSFTPAPPPQVFVAMTPAPPPVVNVNPNIVINMPTPRPTQLDAQVLVKQTGLNKFEFNAVSSQVAKVTVKWDFKDGSVSSDNPVTHLFDQGQSTFAATISDPDGNYAPKIVYVTINASAAPQATATPSAQTKDNSGCTLQQPDQSVAQGELRVLGPDPCNVSFEWELYRDSDNRNPIQWGTFMGSTQGKTFVFPVRGSGFNVKGTLYRLPDYWNLTQYSPQVRTTRLNGYRALGGTPPEKNGDYALPDGTQTITR